MRDLFAGSQLLRTAAGAIWEHAVLIYAFRDNETNRHALTIDVTGRNLPSVTASSDWIFTEAIDTRSDPPPWDHADCECLHSWLRLDGFYLFEADVIDPRKVSRGWVRPTPE